MEKMQVEVIGNGPLLVLVPGGLTGWLSWEPHAKRLSSSRRVARVQLLNVESGLKGIRLPADYSVRTESRALKVTLDELQPSKPIDLVAWSYGALITLDYALHDADRVRSLTLIEPPAIWVLEGKFDAETRKTLDVLRRLHGDISEEQLEEFMYAVGFAPSGKSLRQLPQWPVWSRHRQSLRNSPAVLEHKDNLKMLENFHRPVLLVKGTGSAKFLHQIIDVLARKFPNAEVAEMPGGHSPQMVSMEKFLERLMVFCEKSEN